MLNLVNRIEKQSDRHKIGLLISGRYKQSRHTQDRSRRTKTALSSNTACNDDVPRSLATRLWPPRFLPPPAYSLTHSESKRRANSLVLECNLFNRLCSKSKGRPCPGIHSKGRPCSGIHSKGRPCSGIHTHSILQPCVTTLGPI